MRPAPILTRVEVMETVEADELYERSRAAWPGVEVPREVFAAWVATRDPSRADQLYLACACVNGDRAAIAAFERACLTQVTSSVRRFGSDAFVDDVMQELRQRLFVGVGGKPRLAEYSGRGELVHWVRAVATRVALNFRHAQHDERFTSQGGDEGLLELAERGDDPELAHMKSLYRDEFKKAFAEGMALLPGELRTHLRLYYLDGLGVAQIAELFGSSAPTVSRRLRAGRDEVLERTHALLAARLDVSESELSSIMRLIESRLSVDALVI